MTIKTDIRDFIEQVATYDKKEKTYNLKLDSVTVLEARFSGFINQKLIANGLDSDKVKINYKPLALLFHPDKVSQFTPGMLWLEKELAQETNNGACFKIINTCYESMTIKIDFQKFIEQVSIYDEKGKTYKLKVDSVTVLERNFEGFINQKLLANGLDKDKILSNYKTFASIFQPDKFEQLTPGMQWLEKELAQGTSNGACLNIINTCYDRLINPEKYKNIGMNHVKNQEDFREWLLKLKSKAKTYSGKSLCESLINFLDESKGFYNDVGQIKPKGVRAILQFIPVVFASYGAFLFAEELFAIYALFYVVLKGGEYLETSNSNEIKRIGKTLQGLSMVTAITSTTLLVRILELTFWTSRQFLDASLQLTSAILKPILPDLSSTKKACDQDPTSFCKDLILASGNLKSGIQFKTPELKAISAPLEMQLGLLDQQFFSHYRLADTKRLKIEAFLFKMRVLDSGSESVDQKLIEAQKELDEIKKDKKVYNSKTAVAVQQAEHVISMLSESEQEPKAMQLTIYQPNQ